LADQFSRAINHVGISVTNLEKAIEFYTSTFGFKVLKEARIDTDDAYSPGAIIFKDIFEGRLKTVNAAWLESDNGVGLEIFEFVDPKAEPLLDPFENWKKRFSHICITDFEIDELIKKIEDNGGRKHMDIHFPTKDKEYRLVYCIDPFGNFIEIFTHDFNQFITHQ
jgi:catechol 2,3-dioxygenase-like lactoylglutathione lyase family enzyme